MAYSVSSSSSPSPSSSWICDGSSFVVSSSPPSSLPSTSGCGVDSVDLSVGGGENKLSLGFADGIPKLNPEPDDPGVVVSPALGEEELPNPKPTGFPILPPGFPNANALVFGGEALPKKLAGLSEEDPKILVDVDDVVVALPKRVVLTLVLLLLSEDGGANIDGLSDPVVALLPKIELPNTGVGLDAASELPNALIGLVLAKKFGTLLEAKAGAVEAGREDEMAGGPSVSWLEGRGIDLDVASSTLGGAINEKPDVGSALDVGAGVFEAPNTKADFGGSGRVVDEVSLDLDVMPKGNCAGAEPVGGTNGGSVKPPVFGSLSLAEANLREASADGPDGFGMANKEVVFSGSTLAPNRGAELAVAEPRIGDGCEEPSNSD